MSVEPAVRTPGDPQEGGRPDPPGTRSVWAPLRPLVRRLHFYAGVLIAPFLLVAATTGLLYAASYQVEKIVYAEELRVPVGGSELPVSRQVTAAREAHPEGEVAASGPRRRTARRRGSSFPEFWGGPRPHARRVRGPVHGRGDRSAGAVRLHRSAPPAHLDRRTPSRSATRSAGPSLQRTRRQLALGDSRRRGGAVVRSASGTTEDPRGDRPSPRPLAARNGRRVGGGRSLLRVGDGPHLVDVRGTERHGAARSRRPDHPGPRRGLVVRRRTRRAHGGGRPAGRRARTSDSTPL